MAREHTWREHVDAAVGKYVRLLLARAGDPFQHGVGNLVYKEDLWVAGILREVSDEGDGILERPDGSLLNCWPVLDLELL